MIMSILAMPVQSMKSARGSEVYQNISVNTKSPVFVVDKRFLSVAIDMGELRKHWKNFDFSTRIFTLAKALSPAFVRFGGTDEDFVTFINTAPLQKHHKPIPKQFTITGDDLDKIHKVGENALWDVIFGLNILKRNQDGSWNTTNAEEIMKYVAGKQYEFGWELGNGKLVFFKLKLMLTCLN